MKRRTRSGNVGSGLRRNDRFFKYILWFFIGVYILYFSVLSVQRYRTLYASYYDLGIMHQTVYNSFRAIQTLSPARMLEMTNTIGPEQIYRMAIHNDILLAFLAPFYFINATPAMLLIIQAVVLGAGAWFVYALCLQVFHGKKYTQMAALVFSVCWLLYVPMQRANLFDFHAVVLSSTFLLGMYYFWLTRRLRISLVLFLLSIISKEQVALTTFMFGMYTFLSAVIPAKVGIQERRTESGSRIPTPPGLLRACKLGMTNYMRQDRKAFNYSVAVVGISLVWFLLSVFVIIPYFRGGHHFATERYGQLGGSPGSIIVSVFTDPAAVFAQLSQTEPLRYLYFVLGPLGFLSLLSPTRLVIALPEFAINLLSNEGNMRNIFFHYTAVIQPFVFVSAVYGFRNLLSFLQRQESRSWFRHDSFPRNAALAVLVVTLLFSYFKSPMFYSREKEIHPFAWPQKEAKYAWAWSKILSDENITIAASGQLAPHFAGRRYFYTFSAFYPHAEYVIIRPNEIYNYVDKDVLIPVYQKLVRDRRYRLVEKKDNFEIYKRI